MEVLLGILVAFLGIFSVIILRLVTTFFHEMGHAIPALVFTRKKVEVFIGSYGEKATALNLNFGRLVFYFNKNIFDWQIGMCRHEGAPKSIWKNVLIIIGGPIASLMISIPLILNINSLEPNSFLLFISLVFIAAAVIDLMANLYPSSRVSQASGGQLAYSDGYLLKSIFVRAISPKDYFPLEKKFEAQSYKSVIGMAETILAENPKKRYAYDFIIDSYKALSDPQKALDTYNSMSKHQKLSPEDYFDIGNLYNELGSYYEALRYYKKYHYFNYTDPNLLNEMGKVNSLLGNDEKAVKLFSAAILSTPNYYESYLNRGRIFLKEHELELAEKDLLEAQKYTDSNNKLNEALVALYKISNNLEKHQFYLKKLEDQDIQLKE